MPVDINNPEENPWVHRWNTLVTLITPALTDYERRKLRKLEEKHVVEFWRNMNRYYMRAAFFGSAASNGANLHLEQRLERDRDQIMAHHEVLNDMLDNLCSGSSKVRAQEVEHRLLYDKGEYNDCYTIDMPLYPSDLGIALPQDVTAVYYEDVKMFFASTMSKKQPVLLPAYTLIQKVLPHYVVTRKHRMFSPEHKEVTLTLSDLKIVDSQCHWDNFVVSPKRLHWLHLRTVTRLTIPVPNTVCDCCKQTIRHPDRVLTLPENMALILVGYGTLDAIQGVGWLICRGKPKTREHLFR